ncbi:MAG: glycosyltransferase [Fimbriimonadaceae bacterium]
MAEVDLDRWAVVAPNDDSGFGRQARMFKTVVGVRRQLCIPSDRLPDLPLGSPHDQWMRPEDSEDRVAELLAGLQGIVFFERPLWHPSLLDVSRRLGVKTVCIPNWEWFRGNGADFRQVDHFLCPTRWTVQIVRQYGYTNADYAVWPIDAAELPERRIEGPARVFLHNAGLVDVQDRKGTADAIRAFCRVRRPDIRLIVRIQKEAELPRGDDRVQIAVGNLPSHADLYREGDCAIQPSKMEGIGFMVLEPFCCGLPVITTDAPPMNEWVTDPRLLVRPQWFKRKAFPTTWVRHAHLRIPRQRDLADRIAWCADHDLSDISRQNREIAMERYDPDRVRAEWTRHLEKIVS